MFTHTYYAKAIGKQMNVLFKSKVNMQNKLMLCSAHLCLQAQKTIIVVRHREKLYNNHMAMRYKWQAAKIINAIGKTGI